MTMEVMGVIKKEVATNMTASETKLQLKLHVHTVQTLMKIKTRMPIRYFWIVLPIPIKSKTHRPGARNQKASTHSNRQR